MSITVCLKDFQYEHIVNKSSEQRAVFMITAANIRVKLCTEAKKLEQDTCTFWQVQIFGVSTLSQPQQQNVSKFQALLNSASSAS